MIEGIIKGFAKTDYGYTVDLKRGVSFGIKSEYNYIPKIGDFASLKTHNGNGIRGLNINGEKIFYLTDEQLKEQRRQWIKENRERKENEFLKNKSKMDADFDSLPDCFKIRISHFRENNPNFRIEYEPYELLCCLDAIKIANTLKTPEAVKKYSGMNYDERNNIVKGLSDGHSGNSIELAIMLSYYYLSDPEMVIKFHGGLCMLVGCDKYGHKI